MTEAQTGTYVLLLHLPVDATCKIGELGEIDLPAGFYAYVGGAFGPGGLADQIKAYLSPVKTPHRHIDFLRQIANLDEVWLSIGPTTREHVWADLLMAIPGGVVLVEGFGALDCDCESHLVYFDVRPELEDFSVGAKSCFPNDLIIRAFARDGAALN